MFVTGTDTGVGKTMFTAGLARYALRRGRRPIPFKPVETGCDPLAADAQFLWSAAGQPVPQSSVCAYRFRLPAAPAQAAAAEGTRVDLDRVVAAATELAAQGDLLLVEGAGGLLVPYGDDWTAADLIHRLALPLIVVARTALGTINHTALTVSEARRRQLPLTAVVLNRTRALEEPQERGSFTYLAQAIGMPVLGPLPFQTQSPAPDLLADALESALGRPQLDRWLGL